MRLFVAVDLPEEIKLFLSKINSELSNISGVKTVSKEASHLTLLFLGEIKNVSDVISTLKLIEFKEFEIEVSGFGFFPNEDIRKVLWMGVTPSNNLMMLQKQIASLFGNSSDYKPHITFARINAQNSGSYPAFDKVVNKFKQKSFKFKLNKFKLYSSELTHLGPIHRVLDSFPVKE